MVRLHEDHTDDVLKLADRMERELADMKNKAGMLQTKPAPGASTRDVSPPLDQEPLE